MDAESYSIVKDRSQKPCLYRAGGPEGPLRSDTRWRDGVPPARTALNLGGADRDRTDDLRLAKPALSQLSYSPGKGGGPG
jgi:hypothetical protein